MNIFLRIETRGGVFIQIPLNINVSVPVVELPEGATFNFKPSFKSKPDDVSKVLDLDTISDFKIDFPLDNLEDDGGLFKMEIISAEYGEITFSFDEGKFIPKQEKSTS